MPVPRALARTGAPPAHLMHEQRPFKYPEPYASAPHGRVQARHQRVQRRARQHELVALQDAVHVGALRPESKPHASAPHGRVQARHQRVQRRARQHELVALQDAVHVGATRRQHVHPRQVVRRQPQVLPAGSPNASAVAGVASTRTWMDEFVSLHVLAPAQPLTPAGKLALNVAKAKIKGFSHCKWQCACNTPHTSIRNL